jgi:cysteine desulfurase
MTIKAAIGAMPNSIYSAIDQIRLTLSGAESTKAVLLSTYLDVVRQTGRNHILSTVVEETEIPLLIQHLEPLGCVGKKVPVNAQGQLTAERLEEALTPRTALVSFSWASGLTGVIHPLADLVRLCKEKGVRVHVDATHVIGKLFFRFQDLDVDYLTFDGYGGGGLLVKGDAPLNPLAEGAWSAPAAANLGIALHKAMEQFDHFCTETARLRDKLERGIQEGFPDAVVFFQALERLPHCCAIAFPGVSGEALLYALNRKGIDAHRGKLTGVLKACGVDPLLAECAVSFSLSEETSEEEIDHALEGILSAAHKIRKASVGLI